ncbi:DUF397 domain-containing protein [Nonomuraea sp. NPDC050153]|uniref:DUF397 domain-containing protein n=1 Tax=Nonomuraea sp. NPDC050153 TaxID=3364359 RepID=UPI0037B1BB47
MSRLSESAAWRKSTFCNGASACVEVAPLADGMVGVRDSKLGDASPVLVATAAEWEMFLAAAKADTGCCVLTDRIRLDHCGDGCWLLSTADAWPTALEFDDGEVRAFLAGVREGRFDYPAPREAGDGSGVDGDSRGPVGPYAAQESSPVSQ